MIRFLCVLTSFAVCSFVWCVSASAQVLRYAPAVGNEYHYEISIEMQIANKKRMLRGQTRYRVESVENDEVRMTCSGGLRDDGQSSDGNGPGDLAPFPWAGGNPSPFARTPYRGMTPTTSEVTINRHGELIAMKGQSELPYFLGELSMLPIEPLSRQDQASWTVAGEINIQSLEKRSGLDAIAPFGEVRNDRQLRTATSNATYRLTTRDKNIASIEKTYELKMPVKSENSALELSGTGTWKFNSQIGMPESMDLTYTVKLELGGALVSVPLKLTYKRLSDEEIVRRKAVTDEFAEQARLHAEEARLEAERPLDKDTKRELLAKMRSDKNFDQMKALLQLGAKRPKDPDPEIVAQIKRLMSAGDRAVEGAAKRALKNWDSQYAMQEKLLSSYDSSGTVESTGRKVSASTNLYPGMIIQVRDRSRWRAAEVVEPLSSGRVEIDVRGPFPKRQVVERNDIQLAPEEFPQPEPPKGLAAMATQARGTSTQAGTGPMTPLRSWSDTTGQFTVEAQLMLISGEELVLRRDDGKLLTVPRAKMSPTDQAFVEGLQIQLASPNNPFQ